MPGLELPKTPPPFATPTIDETLDAYVATQGVGVVPAVERALKEPDADAVAELREILLEFYDRVESRHVVLALIERSASDIPELAEFFYTNARQRTTDKPRAVPPTRSARRHWGGSTIPTLPRSCSARA